MNFTRSSMGHVVLQGIGRACGLGVTHVPDVDCFRRGVPLKAVQELMGHATMDMTLRYAHLSPDVRRDAVQLLDAPAQHRRNMKRASPTSPHNAWGKTAGELGFEPR